MLKCYIMIDGNYLRAESIKAFGKIRYNFSSFVSNILKILQKKLSQDITLVRTYYYDTPPLFDSKILTKEEIEFAKRRQQFLSRLNHLNRFEVVLGRVQFKGRDEKGNLIITQKGVDVKMAVDLIDFADKADYVVLITGDNDLVPAIRMAKQKTNANIVLFYFENKKSRLLDELRSEADFAFAITRDLFEI